MKIAFINPASELVHKNEPFKAFLADSPAMYFYNTFWSGFSNGLLILAASTPREHQVVYLEQSRDKIPFDEKFDMVAVTGTTQQISSAYNILDEFKRREPGTLTVAGGPHVSFLPEEAGRHADVVFIGEAEKSWPVFLAELEAGRRRSRYDSSDYGAIEARDVPVPRYELLNPEHYKMTWIQTSRGCHLDCEFCSATRFFGKRYRAKPPDQVLAEIDAARGRLKYQQVLFSDDNLVGRCRKDDGLLAGLRARGISFVAQADISIGNEPALLDQLKTSGCSILFIGLESIEPRNLGLINRSGWKEKMLERYSENIRRISDAGIGVYGAFIVGYDYDTPTTFRDTARFIMDNHLAGSQVTFLTPLPGTRLRARLENEGRLIDNDWRNYTFFDVNIRHPSMSTAELEQELVSLYERIYSAEYLNEKNRFYKESFRRRFKRLAGESDGTT